MVGSSEGSGSSSSSEDRAPAVVESFGWVYHMGVNSIGHDYCHLRFLYVKGKHVMMYKRDLHENPGIKPIRKGVVSNTLMVEELGRRKVNHGDVFVLRFSNRLDDTKKGEIACATAAEARKWVEAFDQARQQVILVMILIGILGEAGQTETFHHSQNPGFGVEFKDLILPCIGEVNKVAENLAKEEEEMTQRSLISDSQCLLEKVTHMLFASQPQLAGSQAAYDLWRGSSRAKINTENEINLEGHRPRLRPYTADGLKKLVRIGKGPEKLLRQSSDLGSNARSVEHLEGDVIDANEAHEWKCILTVNGIRIFEDVASAKIGKGLLMKSIAVIDANLDIVFDVVCNLDKHQRYQWDMLTGDLDLIDSIDGHYDVIYGTYDPKYLTRWHSKRDFVFSRQWFRGQDGSYTILQFPVIHKKRPPRSGYQRTEINPSTWEIRGLNPSPTPSADKCLVTQTVEIHSSGWRRWRHNHYSKFEKTIPCAFLCQVAGLREYFAANPTLKFDSPTTVVHSSISSDYGASCELEDPNSKDEFYDAIASDESLEDEDSDEDVELPKGGKMKLKNVSWAIASLALKQRSALVANTELDANTSPISVDLSQFHGSMRQGKDASDTNCWTSPGGQGFMIRGKTYLTDYSKVVGGDPLLKLLAVDWFTADTKIDKVALYPKCLVQSEAAKKLPFILVINLQVPAKPNYSLALYYGANRPINKGSLLRRFVDGTDMFRDARFKLIPSIKEGYWMVKRAVGSKACILGKAVTCSYLRQDNFLEIDVDIGSSSVAKSIIGLVLGYVTSIVVDLAILIEAKEEKELPEYILGTVRLNRLRTDCAVPF